VYDVDTEDEPGLYFETQEEYNCIKVESSARMKALGIAPNPGAPLIDGQYVVLPAVAKQYGKQFSPLPELGKDPQTPRPLIHSSSEHLTIWRNALSGSHHSMVNNTV
jgi:hypothetical protein